MRKGDRPNSSQKGPCISSLRNSRELNKLPDIQKEKDLHSPNFQVPSIPAHSVSSVSNIVYEQSMLK